MRLRSRHALIHAATLAIAALVSSCDDDDPKHDKHRVTAQNENASSEAWLQPGSPLTPAQWLASRNLATPRSIDDPEVKRLAARLDQANKLYRESERMIANRTVQLEAMLHDNGIREPASGILDDLTRIAGEVGQTEGFGAVSQHYFNLRSSNMDRRQALSTLEARYGRRKSRTPTRPLSTSAEYETTHDN